MNTTDLLNFLTMSKLKKVLKNLKDKKYRSSWKKDQLIAQIETYELEDILHEIPAQSIQNFLNEHQIPYSGDTSQQIECIIQMIKTGDVPTQKTMSDEPSYEEACDDTVEYEKEIAIVIKQDDEDMEEHRKKIDKAIKRVAKLKVLLSEPYENPESFEQGVSLLDTLKEDILENNLQYWYEELFFNSNRSLYYVGERYWPDRYEYISDDFTEYGTGTSEQILSSIYRLFYPNRFANRSRIRLLDSFPKQLFEWKQIKVIRIENYVRNISGISKLQIEHLSLPLSLFKKFSEEILMIPTLKYLYVTDCSDVIQLFELTDDLKLSKSESYSSLQIIGSDVFQAFLSNSTENLAERVEGFRTSETEIPPKDILQRFPNLRDLEFFNWSPPLEDVLGVSHNLERMYVDGFSQSNRNYFLPNPKDMLPTAKYTFCFSPIKKPLQNKILLQYFRTSYWGGYSNHTDTHVLPFQSQFGIEDLFSKVYTKPPVYMLSEDTRDGNQNLPVNIKREKRYRYGRRTIHVPIGLDVLEALAVYRDRYQEFALAIYRVELSPKAAKVVSRWIECHSYPDWFHSFFRFDSVYFSGLSTVALSEYKQCRKAYKDTQFKPTSNFPDTDGFYQKSRIKYHCKLSLKTAFSYTPFQIRNLHPHFHFISLNHPNLSERDIQRILARKTITHLHVALPKYIPMVFRCDLSHLIHLDLSALSLTSLPNYTGKFDRLTYLFLSGNQLTSFPSYFKRAKKLKTLTLANNFISSKSQIRRQFRNLTYSSF